MNQLPQQSPSRAVGRTVVAGLVLIVALYVLLKIVIGLAALIAGPVIFILAIVAVVWAVRVLL